MLVTPKLMYLLYITNNNMQGFYFWFIKIVNIYIIYCRNYEIQLYTNHIKVIIIDNSTNK